MLMSALIYNHKDNLRSTWKVYSHMLYQKVPVSFLFLILLCVSSTSQVQVEVVVLVVVLVAVVVVAVDEVVEIILTSRVPEDCSRHPAATECAQSWRAATRSWSSARKTRSTSSYRAAAYRMSVTRTKSGPEKSRSQVSDGVVRRRVKWRRDSEEDTELIISERDGGHSGGLDDEAHYLQNQLYSFTVSLTIMDWIRRRVEELLTSEYV